MGLLVCGLRPGLVTGLGDALALWLAAMVGRFQPWAIGYGVAAFISLNILTLGAPRRESINPRVGAEFPWLLGRLAVPAVLVAPLAGPGALDGFVRLVPLSVALVLCFRGLIYAGVRAARRRGLVVDPTLIVGAGALGAQIAATLADHEEYGLLPLGFVDDTSEAGLALPVLGGVGELPSLIAATGATRVIVAFGATREPELVSVLRACSALAVEVHVVPRFFELGAWPEGPWTEEIWGIPLLGMPRDARRAPARARRGPRDHAGAGLAATGLPGEIIDFRARTIDLRTETAEEVGSG